MQQHFLDIGYIAIKRGVFDFNSTAVALNVEHEPLVLKPPELNPARKRFRRLQGLILVETERLDHLLKANVFEY